MRRIVVGRPATLTHRFAALGRDVADVSDVAVDVTSDDGRLLYSLDAIEVGERTWSVDLPPLAQVDRLTLEWVCMQGEQARVDTTHVDVAGGTYVAASALGEQSTRLDDAMLEQIIETVERRIDEATGRAWVPRYHRAEIRKRQILPHEPFMLDRWPARQLLWAATGHGTLDDPEVMLDDDQVTLDGQWVRSGAGVLTGPLLVGFSYGADAPPADLADAAFRAALQIAYDRASNRWHERATELLAEGASVNFAAQPDYRRGRVFGMPDVDAVIMSHAEHLPVIA